MRPERDTLAAHLRAGDRVFRYGRWHDLDRVQVSADGQWMYLVTDDDPPRTFHVDPRLFVAAECMPRAS